MQKNHSDDNILNACDTIESTNFILHSRVLVEENKSYSYLRHTVSVSETGLHQSEIIFLYR